MSGTTDEFERHLKMLQLWMDALDKSQNMTWRPRVAIAQMLGGAGAIILATLAFARCVLGWA